MESRANSLRAYAENLLESDNTTLADEEVSGLVDDLIGFAEQWESELKQQSPSAAAQRITEHREPDYKTQNEIYLAALKEIACLGNGDKYGNSDGNVIAQKAIAKASASTDTETDAAGILIHPKVTVE